LLNFILQTRQKVLIWLVIFSNFEILGMDVKKIGNNGLKVCLPGGEVVVSREVMISALVQLGILGFIAFYFGIFNAIMAFIAFCVLYGIFYSIGFLYIRVEKLHNDSHFKHKN